MVLAIPEQLTPDMEVGLKGIGIECLTYKFETKGVKFDKLERFY